MINPLLNEIMQGDTAKIKYLQKMSGRFLTGDTSEEEFYIFFGATTRNGKSTITEILLYLLGDYATTISPESLAIKANKDSRTASPDIAKLAGTRLVVASEPPRRMLFDSSLVKTLTGRDTVSARFLHENEFQFKPKFKLILNSNYLPVISDKTVFSSNRVKVVPFERHFTEKEQNNGQSYRKFYMNRDGFSLLAMGFTGREALEWKLQYIRAFNQMENFIREKSTQMWVETRKAGKLTRKAETDTIQKLVEYAKGQGSSHAEMLYMTYSRLANKMAGINKRDEATVMQLNNLSLMENIILHEVDLGIMRGKHYQEIYRDCKKRLEAVKDLAYLEAV